MKRYISNTTGSHNAVMNFCFDVAFNPKTKRVYRYGKAFVFVNGTAYYFTFRPQQSVDRPNLKIKDVALSVDEVKRLPWDKVSSMARIVVGLGSKKPACLRLKFEKKDHFVFLARAVPKRLNRVRAMESMSRDSKIAKEDEDQCVICLSNVADAKFAPCGNSGVCGACAFKLLRTTKTCPLCRKEVGFFTRVK
jgi:hypothetical protein